MSARHARPTRAQARAGAFALQPQAVWVCPDRVREPVLPYRRGAEAGPSRRRRLARAAQQMLAISAAVTASGLLGLLGGQGTLALWSDGATIHGGSIGLGAAELVIGGSLAEFTNALPGEERHFAFALENSGTVDLTVSTRIEAAAAQFEVRSLIMGVSEDCESYDLSIYPALTTTPVGDPTLMYAGEELQLCAVVTALPTVEPTDTAEFTLLLEGVQTS